MKMSANTFFAILGAAAAGVIVGMLIAPEKGEDLRKNIRNGVRDFTGNLKDALTKGAGEMHEVEAETESARNGKA